MGCLLRWTEKNRGTQQGLWKLGAGSLEWARGEISMVSWEIPPRTMCCHELPSPERGFSLATAEGGLSMHAPNNHSVLVIQRHTCPWLINLFYFSWGCGGLGQGWGETNLPVVESERSAGGETEFTGGKLRGSARWLSPDYPVMGRTVLERELKVLFLIKYA